MDIKVCAVKDEPFEGFYVSETNFQATDEINELNACCLCPEGKKLIQLLYQHTQDAHPFDTTIYDNTKIALTCCFCSTGLKLQTDLINHLLSHFAVKDETDNIKVDSIYTHGTETFQEYPIEDFKPEVSKKERVVRDPETKRFVCSVCFKSFLYKQGLQKHYNNEHDPANVIRVKYQRQDDLGDIKIKCDYCTKTFKHKQGVSKHWGLEHNPEKSFSVAICGSRFNNHEQIKNHVMRHVGLFQKKVSHQRIICDQCSTMVFLHKMKRHKLIHHSDEKSLSKCLKIFYEIQ